MIIVNSIINQETNLLTGNNEYSLLDKRGKIAPVHAMMAYKVHRVIAPLTFNLGTRWS
jgi:hypothetical protein